MLIDSHCHLDFPDFQEDLDAVLGRAQAAGVERMVTICTTMEKFPNILSLAEAHEMLWCSVGVHPHSVAKEPDITAAQIIAHCAHPKVVGIGETGLDFYYDNSPEDIQERVFRAHIEAARETGLPLIIHTREADVQTVRILEDEYAKGEFAGLIHCFTAGRALAERVLDIGFYISLSGIITFKNADAIREVIRHVVPKERILVETDAPYLAPIPMRGKRNEPAFTAHTAAYVSAMLGMDVADFAAQTTDNFYRLFNKAQSHVQKVQRHGVALQ